MSEAGEFEVRVEPGDGATMVWVHGEVDIMSVPQLRAAIDAADRRSSQTVVIDVRDVRFADASFLGLLVTTSTRLEKAGRNLVVRAPGRLLQRLFAVTRVGEVLDIEPT